MPVPVLHVCDKFGVSGSSIHGVSRLFAWWFPRFDGARFDVSLCGLKRPDAASRALAEAGVPVRHLGRGRFDPRILTDLVSLGKQLGARVLHVHGYAAADFGRLAARWLGAGLVLHEHFADPSMPAYQGFADRVLSPLTHRAIAVSGSTRDFLVRERFVPEARVRLIWNGAPLDEFAPVGVDRARSFRREVGLPEDALVVGVIGRLNEQKGHRYFVEAASRIAGCLPDVRFLIVGDGDLETPLREQAARLGIADRLVMTGHRTDIPDALGAIDVLCISSIYEGTPLTLFEAMAAGKPVVSTAVDGCKEVLQDGRTGLLVPAADPESLATALLRVLEDDALRATLAAAAAAAARGYDVRECVRQIEAVYDEVLGEL